MAPAAVAIAERPGVEPGLTATGRPGAPAIVFLHGTRLSRRVWTPQLRALGDEFRAIALDLPGHGDRAAEPFSLAGAVDLVAATIREQAADGRAVVVGLSLGGYVAITLAATYPELVRGLVIAGASAEPAGVRALAFRTLAAALARLDGPRLDRLSSWSFRSRYPASIAEPVVAGGFWSANGAAALRALSGERFSTRLPGFRGPILIINGQFDLLFRWSAPRFAAVAHDVRYVVLPGALHLSNLDRPAAFTLAVREFARTATAA